MKKLCFLAITMLIATGLAVAQDQPQSSNPSSTGASSQTGSQPSQATPATTPDQGAAATPDQNTSDQNATQTKKGAKGHLPQTGSPLPLLALAGFGTTAAGLVTRKRIKK